MVFPGRILLTGCQKRFLYVSYDTNTNNGDVNTRGVCNKAMRIIYSYSSAQLVVIIYL